MIKRIFLFIFGVLMCSYSLMFIIIYLNLLKMEFTFLDYIKYMINSIECLIIIPGILLIILSLRKKNKYEIIVNNINGGNKWKK